MSAQLPLRKDLDPQYTWDLSLLYPNQEAYQVACQEFLDKVAAFKKTYQGQLTDQANILKALASYDEIRVQESHLSHYATLGYEVDKTNETYEENNGKFSLISESVEKDLSFFVSELSLLEDDRLHELGQTSEGHVYQAFLDQVIRSKKTRLSPELEELLSGLGNSLYSNYELYGALKFQDMVFHDFQVEGETYHNSFAGFEQDYEGHSDRQVRLASWQSFHEGLEWYQHTAARNYIQHVETEKKEASLRGFDSVIDYLLFDQEVSRENYNQIIDTYTKDFAPVMRRYAKMLAKQHGMDKLSLADIKMTFAKGPITKISYEESRQMIEEALAPLGSEYMTVVNRAFDQAWIDYPMNQTKSTGGFCASVYDGPSYILLNWTAALSEVLVLAHELGHAGHFQLTHQSQSILASRPSLYFVEAPSTANEVIMCSYLLNQPLEDKAKGDLIAEFISRTYFHNMVTHLLEADYQRKVYTAVDQGQVLNAAKLRAFFQETLENFWGDAVDINEGADLTWMRQPHYFMGLYSYTYSAGLTIGTQIGQRIAAGDQEAIQAWLGVLKAGGTHKPLDLASQAGVDMSDKATLLSTVAYVDQLLDRIEQVYQ